ncbi:MAG: BREX-6 system adenine-specific DNA-methyltransferase PglX [Oculatellaceae cyanobacterium Prado106]|nr:BREX-6 system adenine-specific DNA-methyltransferase PglX [Oculatellaceae cyanobacterium Prado106]
MSQLAPEVKNKLSSTIRSLRDRLLTDLHNATESAYRLSIKAIDKAGLAEEPYRKRQRLEQWLEEQVRAEAGKKGERDVLKNRHLRSALTLAAATMVNRLVVIKQMEAQGWVKPAVVTGGWQSRAYKEFREFAPDLCRDETEGYGTLLQWLYDELAIELPGLFGRVGLTELFPVGAGTLRSVVEALNAPGLAGAWLDDTTLGWVYQYWNDPEREALDEKVAAGGKIENYEIASKTQIFTERYMVEWLLQNSLNQQWLAICNKNGWTSEAEANGVLKDLEERREEWRKKRESGHVSPEEIMPILTEEEHRWKYWMPPMPSEEFIEDIPRSIQFLKILDPAVGSGHFLIIAFTLLTAFYEEEARHLCVDWTSKQIAEWIIEKNLHGVDIDLRAVQIAAASLFLKAKVYAKDAAPKTINLVASNFGLAQLPKDDPAIIDFKRALKDGIDLPEEFTDIILDAVQKADHLGSLLKIDKAVQDVLAEYRRLAEPRQMLLGESEFDRTQRVYADEKAKESIIENLVKFLERCTSSEDLGLRLKGEQLAAGVRFIQLVRKGEYDLVIANPPYLGAAKMSDRKYIEENYSISKSDLYAVFLQRGVEMVEFSKLRGFSAMITMRGWMFIKEFERLRTFVLPQKTVSRIADLHFGAFPEMKDVSVTMSILVNSPNTQDELTYFLQPVRSDLIVRDSSQIKRNISGLMVPNKVFEHYLSDFRVIKGQPFVYWWDDEFFKAYAQTSKMKDESDVRQGLATSNDTRYVKKVWEVDLKNVFICSVMEDVEQIPCSKWIPFIKGAASKVWFEPMSDIIEWSKHGLTVKTYAQKLYGSYSRTIKNESYYFNTGIAFSMVGATFTARVHRFRSVFGHKGSSVFPKALANCLCLLNSSKARYVLESLNPGIGFEVGDVNRLPLFPIESADEIFAQLDRAFTQHEAARETSVEFQQPGATCWNYAQAWAQQAVDRPAGAPLPDWEPVYEAAIPEDWLSYSIGIALGRFDQPTPNLGDESLTLGDESLTLTAESLILTDQNPTLNHENPTLPHGILYLSAYNPNTDSLSHPASQPIHTAWTEYGRAIAKGKTLNHWLRHNFFKDVHLGRYENRPIYFPLSSKAKNFVAHISIHRWHDTTLTTLLSDYLIPEFRQLEGELADLLETRSQGDTKAQTQAEKRYSDILQLRDELKTFIDQIRQTAEQHPPKANPKDPDCQTAARFTLDLDDGVMINSAALWNLLEPQWTKPKTWWSELCTAQGKKDYDWSHLAARYFRDRVDAKCQKDPSLAVAHGCFWKYHPAKAYEWELRLQDEIAPDFTIDEMESDRLRLEFETTYPQVVLDLREKEEKRRDRKRKKEGGDEFGPLFEQELGEEEE